MRYLKCLMMFAATTSAVWATKWESGVPAVATYPQPGVNGDIYYTQYRSAQPTEAMPNRDCVLFHGHGVTQQLLSDFIEPFDTALAIDVSQIGSFLPPNMQARIDKLAHMTSVGAFGDFMFGKVIPRLLENSCANVWIVVQESVQSTTLEMTVRSERFLRDVVCRGRATAQGQNVCAVMGHSKGGIAVTQMVRRCASQTSELGAAGCAALGEVYSASGPIQGAGLPVVLMAAYNEGRGMGETKDQLEAAQKSAAKVFGDFAPTSVFEKGMADLGMGQKRMDRLNELGDKAQIDVLGPKTPESNPVWYDLGPGAPMENGVPLAVINGSQFIPQRVGWLGAVEYSASGTGFDFGKFTYPETTDAEGVVTYGIPQGQAPWITGGTLPAPDVRPRLLAGNRFPRVAQLLDFMYDPFPMLQEKVDGIITEKLADFHGDKGAPLMFTKGLGMLGAKNPELKAELTAFSATPAQGKSVVLSISDGFVERGSALGACERGAAIADASRIVDECVDMKNIHHLGLSGMSIQAADHIVKAFSTRRP